MATEPKTLRTPESLISAGLLRAADAGAVEAVASRYAMAVSGAMAGLIDPNDPHNPIARQFVPSADELQTMPEERADPIGDREHSPVQGIVHRYPDRVLLKAVHTCPVYCRFCFRREMVGPDGDGTLNGPELEAALGYIRAHPQIWEVILTGGDPFILSPRRLKTLVAALNAIEHVKVIRFHTRVPVVEPEWINSGLVEALRSRKAVYVAIHANHAKEFSEEARSACARLADAGISLLGQTVLLRGVNDDVEMLGTLMRTFVENRIKPYYLHHPDLAPGTGHFRLSIEEGRALVRSLRGNLSGLCQPEYVLDIPGGHGKSPLAGEYASRLPESCGGGWQVQDYRGRKHAYPPMSETDQSGQPA